MFFPCGARFDVFSTRNSARTFGLSPLRRRDERKISWCGGETRSLAIGRSWLIEDTMLGYNLPHHQCVDVLVAETVEGHCVIFSRYINNKWLIYLWKYQCWEKVYPPARKLSTFTGANRKITCSTSILYRLYMYCILVKKMAMLNSYVKWPECRSFFFTGQAWQAGQSTRKWGTCPWRLDDV